MAKTMSAALSALEANGGSMDPSGVGDWTLANVELTEWEQEEAGKGETARWWKFMGFSTLVASRSGFMVKDRGTWTITEQGSSVLKSLEPLDLYQAAHDGYNEWKAMNDDEESEEAEPSDGEMERPSGLAWTRPHVMHAGLSLLSRSPGQQMDVDSLIQRLPGLVPDDVRQTLDDWNVDWQWEQGYRTFERAVRAQWLIRKSGVWTVTSAGCEALRQFTSAEDLWTAARAICGDEQAKSIPYLGDVFNAGGLPQTLYSNQSSTVQQLVSQVEQGALALPDIQRPFVWKNTKVRDLLDSMFRGFPFGFVLTWRSPNETRTKQIGTEGKGIDVPHALVIDGQQRLTSLYAVMTGKAVLDNKFKERRIQIAFHPIRGSFEVADAAIRKSPEWIHDVSSIFSDGMGALSVLQSYLSALEAAREITQEHREAAEQNIQRLVNLRNTPLGILEIAQDTDEEQVAEIFVRINSKGQNLKQADFILTLLAVFWEEGRAQLEEFARACKVPSPCSGPSPFNRLLQPGPDDMIRVVVALSHRRARLSAAYQVLRGKNAQTGRVTSDDRDKNLAILSAAQDQVLKPAHWHEFLKTLESAGYRTQWLVQSMNAALMSYAFFLIGRTGYALSVPDLRRVIGRWFAFVSLTGRYSGSPESIMEEDLARLRELEDGDGPGFINALESAIESELTEDFWTFTLPARLESSNIRTITSFFAAQCKLGAKALYSNLTVSALLDPERRSTRKDLEIHHLFPKAWLKANGVTHQREYNQIANQTFVEWSINAEIGDKDPADYAPEYESGLDEATRSLHAVPEGWWSLSYEEFLTARRSLMASVIRQAFEEQNT